MGISETPFHINLQTYVAIKACVRHPICPVLHSGSPFRAMIQKEHLASPETRMRDTLFRFRVLPSDLPASKLHLLASFTSTWYDALSPQQHANIWSPHSSGIGVQSSYQSTAPDLQLQIHRDHRSLNRKLVRPYCKRFREVSQGCTMCMHFSVTDFSQRRMRRLVAALNPIVPSSTIKKSSSAPVAPMAIEYTLTLEFWGASSLFGEGDVRCGSVMDPFSLERIRDMLSQGWKSISES